MPLNAESLQKGRNRLTQVFHFLEDLNQKRNPAKRKVSEYSWTLWLRDLPDHPTIIQGTIKEIPAIGVNEDIEFAGDDFILKVLRPTLTQPPQPPQELELWLKKGWERIEGSVEVFSSLNRSNQQGQTVIEKFEDKPQRQALFLNWKRLREEWVFGEMPAREAMKIFERLFELYGQIEREAEQVEVVLGDGILDWPRQEGNIYHPILLQRLQLEFDPQIPQFTLRESDHPVEFYSSIFSNIPDVDSNAISDCRSKLSQPIYHPLGGDTTSAFFKYFINRLSLNGEFVENEVPKGETEHPRLRRAPVIFMRNRALGYATAINSILEDINTRPDLPVSLLNIVGIEPPLPEIEGSDDFELSGCGNEDEHILLSKPANPEQLQIARRLQKYGCVLVQGPPGTGKTHTIANLIGHLLAAGKSVLVTSHTTKALRVLKEQVVEELQPLCVSVLENDSDSRKQLEISVNAIDEKLSSSDADVLEREADQLESERKKILERLRQSRIALLNARTDEYRDIVVAGESCTPSNAARKVAAGKGTDDWIPAPVKIGAPLPLTIGELIDLYRTNATVTKEDEKELGRSLPNPHELLSPVDFERFCIDQKRITDEPLSVGDSFWVDAVEVNLNCSNCNTTNRLKKHWLFARPICGRCKILLPLKSVDGKDYRTADPDMIANLYQGLLTVVKPLQEGTSGKWKLSVIFAGRQGGKERKIWDKLVEIIASVCTDAASASEQLVKFGPSLPADQSLEDSILILDDIISHLSSGGSLNFFTLLTRPYWRRFIAAAKTNNRKPSQLEDFQALKVHALLQKSRNELLNRWDRMFVPLGGPKSSELGNRPEISCRQFTQTIVNCLDWHNKNWKPVEEELVEIGFCWERFIHEEVPNLSPCGELLRLRDAINKMPDILASRANQVRLFQIEQTFASLLRKIESAGDGAASAHVVRALKESVKHKNTAEYRIAFNRLFDLHNRSTDLSLRHNLLKRLEPVAPGWAADVRDRIPPHDKSDMPGESQKAWLWRQLNEELQIRSAKSVNEMQHEIASLTEELKRTTGRLIAHRAWANQVRKINKDINKRMALKGWQQTVRAMGARTGKRVPQLLKKARELMNQSQSAVPVWIMPLSRVVENFDPKTSRFDVVIIDEASQSDLMGFAALYLGKQVVVVGDHEQVSPLAAGQSIENVDNLINLHLSGIPLNHLYVPTTSLYDMAKTSFGGMICLREHFRCVPEIIQFSNALSYNWQIKPLRDSSLVQLKPATIAYRVESGSSDDKVNETEALAVASLLIAAIEQSEYSGKTFGVISLVGEEQALEIEKILRTHLTPTVIESRRIVCGNSAQFQGDERDVMFLSMVDGPKEGPLALRQAGANDMFKKRFNVAASRAKDQMWVVHSLNVEIDLKPGDLRRRLVEHAMNPSSLMEQLQQGERQTESEFERLVHRWLVTEGYKLIPQWRVGHYRIDLVVKGKSRLLAVECDGDRFHPAEKLAEEYGQTGDFGAFRLDLCKDSRK